MRKISLIVVSLALMLSLSGCGILSEVIINQTDAENQTASTDSDDQGPETEPAVNNGQNNDSDDAAQSSTNQNERFVVRLLPGWPADLVPIHEDLTIMNTFYQVDGNKDFFSDGRFSNQYLVGTSTTKDPEPILDYYEKLFERIDFKSDQAMRGDIGIYSVLVRHSVMDPTYLIYIEVDIPDSQLARENRYYQDFPGHLVEIPDDLDLYKTMYSISDNRGGEYRYSLDYDTQMVSEDFIAFFTSRYEDKTGLKQSMRLDSSGRTKGIILQSAII